MPSADIPCLGGVETSCDKTKSRTWKSTGKGKKRKKPKCCGKKRCHKRPKIDVSDVSMTSAIEQFQIQNSMPIESTGPMGFKSPKKTAGDGKTTTKTQGNVTATQASPVSCGGADNFGSQGQARRGGAGGDGGGGGKPPKKPVSDMPCAKCVQKRSRKKKISTNEVKVDTTTSKDCCHQDKMDPMVSVFIWSMYCMLLETYNINNIKKI